LKDIPIRVICGSKFIVVNCRLSDITMNAMNRRCFIRLGALTLLARPAFSDGRFGRQTGTRSLSFYNLHTAERLDAVYWADGEYIPDALAEINRILRDHRSGDVFPMAPRLLDMLAELRDRLESAQPFEIISGYRSPKTNAMLRAQGHGVAENSLHLKGMAADVRLPGRDLDLLRRAAISLKAGGVGYYPASQFVHVDIGRVRTW